jgi:hypothetical protein
MRSANVWDMTRTKKVNKFVHLNSMYMFDILNSGLSDISALLNGKGSYIDMQLYIGALIFCVSVALYELQQILYIFWANIYEMQIYIMCKVGQW